MWQLGGQPPTNNVPTQIGVHDAPIKAVRFVKSTNMVVTGGWDRKLKFWDTRTPNPAAALDLPERVYAMDIQDNLLVVATANRQVLVYDVQGQPREHERKESPLKYQTRCVECFPDQTGYAIGSIEGRVGIQYVQKPQGKDSFAFKCHRKENSVYSVNAIAFHAPYGTFATVGSDGVINFWDKDNKQRLKGFNAISRTISAAKFNAQGNMFAYASSYDWSQGYRNPQEPGNDIFVHNVLDEEVRPKNKKSSYRN
jgi:mRNA export factor